MTASAVRIRRKTHLFVLPWGLEKIGGVNQVVINICRQMQRFDSVSPLVLTSDWNSRHPSYKDFHGINTVHWRIRSWRPDMPPKEKFAYWLWEKTFRQNFQKLCEEHHVSVVNPHFPDATSLSLHRIIRGMKHQAKFVLSFHGSDITRQSHSTIAVKREWKKMLLDADGIVVCSKALGEKLSETFQNKILYQCIHNGVNPVDLIGKVEQRCLPNRKFILNIGKFDHVKGQDTLINSFAIIANDYPNIDLVMIGASGNAFRSLQDLCAKLNVVERVQFHKDLPHHEVAGFLSNATAFVLSSRLEAFPIVILEAGAFGLPVIASRVGGIPEIVQDGETGRLVSSENPSELSSVLRWVLDNPVNAKNMGLRLRDLVNANFTWSLATKKYCSFTSPT